MSPQLLGAYSASLMRFLAAAIILASLLAVSGIACGGDDADRSSRSSRSSDRDSSSSDAEESGSSASSGRGILGSGGSSSSSQSSNEGRDSGEGDEQSSSTGTGLLGGAGSSGASRSSGDGRAPRVLGIIPNLEYEWLMIVDTAAYRSGEVPAEVRASAEEEFEISQIDGYITSALAGFDAGITSDNVDKLIVLEWDYDMVLAIQGGFSSRSFSSSLDSSPLHSRIQDEDIDYDVWDFDRDDTVAIVNDQVYWLEPTFSSAREFLDPVAQGDSILDDPQNPLVRAISNVGDGWLVSAMSASTCYNFNINLDEDTCLAMAFAASSAGDSTIAITWAVLLDGQDSAALLAEGIGDQLQTSNNVLWGIENIWISSVAVDGDFVVMTLSLTASEGDELIEDWF